MDRHDLLEMYDGRSQEFVGCYIQSGEIGNESVPPAEGEITKYAARVLGKSRQNIAIIACKILQSRLHKFPGTT
jgi:hypothetical protein